MLSDYSSDSAIQRPQAAIIMAAGQGTRMKSRRSKILHEIAGHSLIYHVVRCALDVGMQKIVLVLGYQSEQIKAHIDQYFPDAPITCVIQEQQLGTAHAVLCAQPALLDFQGDLWILSGDVPTLNPSIFQQMQKECAQAQVAVAGMHLEDPKSYGRLLTDEQGLYAIREAKDCQADELLVQDVNAGFYRVDSEILFTALKQCKTDNAQGEYYLTDLVSYARAHEISIAHCIFQAQLAQALEGVNDRIDLALAEKRIQKRLVHQAMRNGVTFLDPQRVYLHTNVIIESDVTIEADVMLLGNTKIAQGVYIEQGSRIQDSTIDTDTRVHAYSHIQEAHIGSKCMIGPFARLRTGTYLAEEVKIGNFVETKKASLGRGSKASHLTYLGDAEIGSKVNIGAGTITCNYDGYQKHQTKIEDYAFIGSNTSMVAPVHIGKGALIAAGSSITQDVSPDALALARASQTEKSQWAARFHQSHTDLKSPKN